HHVYRFVCYSYSLQLQLMVRVLCKDRNVTRIYTLSLHDALPICGDEAQGNESAVVMDAGGNVQERRRPAGSVQAGQPAVGVETRSEEHTSELQSRENLVCRLLLEKKKQIALNVRYRHYSRKEERI